jgi:hypothetical protein
MAFLHGSPANLLAHGDAQLAHGDAQLGLARGDQPHEMHGGRHSFAPSQLKKTADGVPTAALKEGSGCVLAAALKEGSGCVPAPVCITPADEDIGH